MVLARLVAGGAEVSALRLVRALRPRGYEFVVAAMRGGGELTGAFRQAGAEVREPLARGRWDLPAAWRIARLCCCGVEALVVVDVPRNGLVCGLVGSLLSRRRMARLCWCKSVPGGQSGPFAGLLRAAQRLGLLDAVVCAARHQRSALVRRGLDRRRMPLVRNGVEAPRAGTWPADVPPPAGRGLLVHVANATADKDFPTLLAAAGLLARRRDDFRLLLVGRGTDSPDMARRIARAGAGGVVAALGRRDDVGAILASADALVLSSRSEVLNVAVLEALAAGLPVVATDLPAFKEVFTHGREGLKAPPGDAEALAVRRSPSRRSGPAPPPRRGCEDPGRAVRHRADGPRLRPRPPRPVPAGSPQGRLNPADTPNGP